MSAPTQQPSRAQLRRIQRAAGEVLTAVGIEVAAAQSRLRPQQVHRKARGDFVTNVDLRAERQLRQRLLAITPEAGFLGEERARSGLDRDLVWVVDPIDGTSNFANGLPHFAVAAALLHRRRPMVAAIWSAPERCLYTAVRGDGARRAGRRIQRGRGRLSDAALIGCQWHRGHGDLELLARLQQGGARLRTLGCTVVQILDVAMGRLDANVQPQGHVWDFAAAGLVLTEAGGRLTGWRGERLWPLPRLDDGHTATVAAASNIHRRLLGWLDGVSDPLVVPRR